MSTSRDLEMAIAAYTLARLTEQRQAAADSLPIPLGGHTTHNALAN
jgi:hypothetical protein